MFLPLDVTPSSAEDANPNSGETQGLARRPRAGSPRSPFVWTTGAPGGFRRPHGEATSSCARGCMVGPRANAVLQQRAVGWLAHMVDTTVASMRKRRPCVTPPVFAISTLHWCNSVMTSKPAWRSSKWSWPSARCPRSGPRKCAVDQAGALGGGRGWPRRHQSGRPG